MKACDVCAAKGVLRAATMKVRISEWDSDERPEFHDVCDEHHEALALWFAEGGQVASEGSA